MRRCASVVQQERGADLKSAPFSFLQGLRGEEKKVGLENGRML
jgi:hypothetical protein